MTQRPGVPPPVRLNEKPAGGDCAGSLSNDQMCSRVAVVRGAGVDAIGGDAEADEASGGVGTGVSWCEGEFDGAGLRACELLQALAMRSPEMRTTNLAMGPCLNVS